MAYGRRCVRLVLISTWLLAIDVARGQCEDFKLTAPDASQADEFGFNVGMDLGRVIVGARRSDWGGAARGAAYLFRLVDDAWQYEAKLIALDCQAGDEFGNAVAVSGRTVLVGAKEQEPAGAAYFFRLTNGLWLLEQKVSPTDGYPAGEFGNDVDVCGDTAVIGRWHDDAGGPISGAAYVFERAGDHWTQVAELVPADGEGYETFGYVVAIDGDVIVVGAHHDQDNDAYSGSVYVFRRGQAGWIEEAKLLASDGTYYDRFGTSVAVAGDLILVGSMAGNDEGLTAGAVYVFRRTATGWHEQAILTPDGGGTPGYAFGNDVAIIGNLAVIGSTGDESEGFAGGSAYVFAFDGDRWQQETRFTSSDLSNGDYFAYTVASAGDRAVLGAWANDDDGFSSGSAYVFGFSPCNGDLDHDGFVGVVDLIALMESWGTVECAADLDGNGTVDVPDLLTLLAAWGDCAE